MAAVEQKADSTVATNDNADPKEKAFTHLAQGKRHLLVKDYAEAVASLAVASELLAEVYGEAANECGDAYFNYGRALLGLAREEAGVLGDAVEEEPEDSEENDADEETNGEKDGDVKEEDCDMEVETKGERSEDVELKGDAEKEKDKEAATEAMEESGEKGEPKPESTEKVGEGSKGGQAEGEENGKGDSEEEDDADTVSNLKLAWEMLELVKIIFQRQADGDKQISLKLAEVYMYLGEIGLESVNYDVAIEDINKCLEIRKGHLGEDDRRVAETLYNLGLAHSLANNFDDSIKYFTEALCVLELRIKNLENKKESGEDCSEELKSDAFYTVDGEINELKVLLPEIKEKIADMEDSKKETLKALFEKRCGDMQGVSSSTGDVASSSSSVSATEAKPASDISHLIRKKRKLEPDSTDDAKKSKQEEPSE